MNVFMIMKKGIVGYFKICLLYNVFVFSAVVTDKLLKKLYPMGD